MTDSTAATPAAPLGLISRIIGVITSPKATFERIVAVPRPAGVLLVVALVMGATAAAPQFTQAGKQAVADAQMQAAARRGTEVTPEQAAVVARISTFLPYMTFVSSLIFLPIVSLVLAGLYWVAFTTVMGGTATFKQALAVVTHSQVIGALGLVVGLPIMLMKPTVTMGGPFNLGALVPNLEAGSKLATMLSNISVFSFWGMFVTAVGLAVLYRRKTMPIFVALLVIFGLFTYGWSALFG